MKRSIIFKTNKKGFSLVEMLVALLVASLLMVALAPVMTKKFNESLKIRSEGVGGGSVRKVVYLTDPNDTEWLVPNGITTFTITLVGAGGGGGAGLPWGCEVFTRDTVAQGSILTPDSSSGCGHTRGDSSNFRIPEGITELRATLIGGAAGGGAGSGVWEEKEWKTATSTNWAVPEIAKGDRVLVRMNGAGGGGGGVDQGGGGGGASGGFVNWTAYDIASSVSQIPVIVGAGGRGGYYHWSPGAGGSGYAAGSAGVSGTSGGGGGGSSSFGGTITAYGGGGGAGSGVNGSATGWHAYGKWETVFNYGGSGRNGGTRGPVTIDGTVYGGASGGTGGSGNGSAYGGAGGNGNVGTEGKAIDGSRGGTGGTGGVAGTGAGGYGQDYKGDVPVDATRGAGGAGGGGGGSFFSDGGSAFTGCYAIGTVGEASGYPQAGTGAGGAGGSCGWNRGRCTAQRGGDGIVIVNYLKHAYGGGGGQAGPTVPPSKIALTSSMKSGADLIITPGIGGAGGDRVVAHPNGNNKEIRTKSNTGTVNSTTTLTNAYGKPGTESTIKFGSDIIARTGTPSCGGGYSATSTTGASSVGGTCRSDCGSRNKAGTCIAANFAYHGHQGASCTSTSNPTGENIGKNGTQLSYNSTTNCGGEGGALSSRNGGTAQIGGGGGGGYYGGTGSKGGDGYVRIEWGAGSSSQKYSGGGGSSGEVISKVVTISPLTRKIKYRIGTGGTGGKYDKDNITMLNGSDGNATSFGIGESWGFTSKGGKGGGSASLTSVYDSNFILTSLTGNQGAGGVAQCTNASSCIGAMNGKIGGNGTGGAGGTLKVENVSKSISKNSPGGAGGSSSNLDGSNAVNFDGSQGGGAGGGGGAGAKNGFGNGGNGANGYIIIEYTEHFN